MSINRQAASITTNDAADITYDQTLFPQIGSASAAQQALGIDGPNVQAALDQIYDSTTVQPGAIVVTLSALNPNTAPTVSYSQVSKVTVTGTPVAGTLMIAGYQVPILATDTTTQIATKISTALAANTTVFSSAVASTNTVTYTYIDSHDHQVDNNIQLGLTVSTTTTTYGGTPGYLGYGWWELLGSEAKYGKTFYSWLRIS